MDPDKPRFVAFKKKIFYSSNYRRGGNYNRDGGAGFSRNTEDDNDVNDYQFEEEIGDGKTCDDLQFEQDGSGFSHSLVVPSEFYGMIIGFKGQNLNKLEFSTRCRIILPKRDNVSNSNVVLLKSISKENILRARSKILGIVNRSRSQLKPNHFISIPLNDERLIRRFNEFKRQVLIEAQDNRSKYKGISEIIFQEPKKLHLTICVLLILSKTDEKRHVIQVLDNLYRNKILDIVKGKRIIVKIKGLGSFDEDTNAVDVVYGKIEPNEDLQYISEMIAGELKKTICRSRERPDVRLHLTLLNSQFVFDRKNKEGGWRDRKPKKEKIAATELINNFGDYDFGRVEVKSIELSLMSAKDESGYYKSVFSMPLVNVT